MLEHENWNYSSLKETLRSETPPLMVVKPNPLRRNVRRIIETASNANKSLRIASKSVRVPELLERIRDWAGDTYEGLMTYSPEETRFLHERGFEDFIVAYPRVNASPIRSLIEVNREGSTARLMVDEPAHLEAIDAVYRNLDTDADPLPVCIELDVSYRPFKLTHLGVRRSPIRNLNDYKSFYERVRNHENVSYAGTMAYEAQLAGVPDSSPYQGLEKYLVRMMKRFSRPDVRQTRGAVGEFLDSRDDEHLFNGGGTGSLDFTVRDKWVTEVTVGSGFLQSHLFDYYQSNENEPAYCFALPVTRRPDEDIVTCQSGGFIASGPTDDDKAPRPFLPADVETLEREGYGEVQTPLRIPKTVDLDVGDPVFFRPAKAGEIAERFNEYLLVKDGTVVDRLPTYRGLGECFY